MQTTRPSQNPPTLTLEELHEWLGKLRRSQEFNTPTNITRIEIHERNVDGRQIVLITKG